MTLDDRLRTVLGVAIDGERSALAQYRQLVDLLGSGGSVADGQLVASAILRLSVLSRRLPVTERVAILGEPGLRLRTASLVAQLCEGDEKVAEAAISAAALNAEGWNAVLPMLANGLRSRAEARMREATDANTPAASQSPDNPAPQSEQAPAFVEQANDTPAPSASSAPPVAATPRPSTTNTAPTRQKGTVDIAGLVGRIELYREQRASRAVAESRDGRAKADDHLAHTQAAVIDCRIGPDSRIGWAGTLPQVLNGVTLGTGEDAAARIDTRSATALRRQQVIRSGEATIAAPAAIAGRWRLDAVPRFDPSGRFLGHHARLTRLPELRDDCDVRGDEVRQALHELRTPLGAIQGFAEIIQQQLFGDVPNRYRAKAADIAAESARLLASLEEVERLVRLHKGVRDKAGEGATGDAAAVGALLGQLANQFSAIEQGSRAQFVLIAAGADVHVAMSEADAETMLWRLMATLSAAAKQGERLDIVLDAASPVKLTISLPQALRHSALFDAEISHSVHGEPALGMLGAGFALRLVAAEARAAGGSFSHDDERVMLRLPRAVSASSLPSANAA